ncbi:hypothetical protein BJY04DRAFT_82311 [Aspergillus karnatakaensis]|uniref:uncharacterized protein n=1 Tax=Aspergillus karnatakaensis TaxID=1810916 RepID=UPI003CCD99AD
MELKEAASPSSRGTIANSNKPESFAGSYLTATLFKLDTLLFSFLSSFSLIDQGRIHPSINQSISQLILRISLELQACTERGPRIGPLPTWDHSLSASRRYSHQPVNAFFLPPIIPNPFLFPSPKSPSHRFLSLFSPSPSPSLYPALHTPVLSFLLRVFCPLPTRA